MSIRGRTIHTTSNPVIRDSDQDGMSDGVERRLNGVDAARYPFHPLVFNDPPVRLYSELDDLDQVLAVGASTIVTTTVVNGTAIENELIAAGTFSATLPSQLGGATGTKNFTLLPSTSANIVLNGVAASANGTFEIDSGAAADLFSVGAAATGPADDIILDQPVPVTIDSDLPTIPALTQGAFVQPGRTIIIGGTADDATSYVSRVDVSVNGGPFSAATGTSVWAFAVDVPSSGSVLPINVRSFDAVDNTNSASFNLTLDDTSPTLTVDLRSRRGAHRAAQRRRQLDPASDRHGHGCPGRHGLPDPASRGQRQQGDHADWLVDHRYGRGRQLGRRLRLRRPKHQRGIPRPPGHTP